MYITCLPLHKYFIMASLPCSQILEGGNWKLVASSSRTWMARAWHRFLGSLFSLALLLTSRVLRWCIALMELGNSFRALWDTFRLWSFFSWPMLSGSFLSLLWWRYKTYRKQGRRNEGREFNFLYVSTKDTREKSEGEREEKRKPLPHLNP